MFKENSGKRINHISRPRETLGTHIARHPTGEREARTYYRPSAVPVHVRASLSLYPSLIQVRSPGSRAIVDSRIDIDTPPVSMLNTNIYVYDTYYTHTCVRKRFRGSRMGSIDLDEGEAEGRE